MIFMYVILVEKVACAKNSCQSINQSKAPCYLGMLIFELLSGTVSAEISQEQIL